MFSVSEIQEDRGMKLRINFNLYDVESTTIHQKFNFAADNNLLKINGVKITRNDISFTLPFDASIEDIKKEINVIGDSIWVQCVEISRIGDYVKALISNFKEIT